MRAYTPHTVDEDQVITEMKHEAQAGEDSGTRCAGSAEDSSEASALR